MMKEEVITTVLPVKRIGEMICFQLRLPDDTKRIIGLEYGATGMEGTLQQGPSFAFEADEEPLNFVAANKIIGQLSLSGAGCEGIFFQGDLVEDRNIQLHEDIALVLWEPNLWTHAGKREEIPLSVTPSTGFVEGVFRDSYGKNEYESLSYRLHLYLWIEKCST